MSRMLAFLGISITLIYSTLLAWLVNSKWEKFVALELNALGDFCAGAFGPLAILWLVLGYFQQGIELRQNSKALDLQAKELANAVDQYKQLVETAREQRDFDKYVHLTSEARQEQLERIRRNEEQPKFTVRRKSMSVVDLGGPPQFILKNEGQTCWDLTISCDGPPVTIEPASWAHFDRQFEATITVRFPTPLDATDRTLTLRYIDRLSKPASIAGTMTVGVGQNRLPLPQIQFNRRPILEPQPVKGDEIAGD